MLPAKIGGSDEGESKNPGVLIAFGSMKKPKMPSHIGGSDSEEPEGEGESISNEQAMDDATDEILAAVGGSRQSHNRLKNALKAFCYACDAEPHGEGEHTNEDGDE